MTDLKKTTHQPLSDAAARDSLAAIQALVAAERAVEEGRLNLAKVLRAMAHAARLRAMATNRLLDGQSLSRDLFEALYVGDAASVAALGSDELTNCLAVAGTGRSNAAVFEKARRSLADNRDVTETDVAQLIWACQECGLLLEGSRTDICPSCGTLGGEFELFAPFFSGTAERLMRRQPSEIKSALRSDPDVFLRALDGIGDDSLRRPAPDGGWCMKEIAGHMIDIAELYCRRLRAYQEPATQKSPERTPLPWKLLDGQGYTEKSAAELTQHFRTAIAEALVLTERLAQSDWSHKAELVSGRVAVIDMASWLVNHNLAHLKQIEALRTNSE